MEQIQSNLGTLLFSVSDSSFATSLVGVLTISAIGAVFVGLYLLPILMISNCKNTGIGSNVELIIGLVNILLGWTLIIWVTLFLFALLKCSSNRIIPDDIISVKVVEEEEVVEEVPEDTDELTNKRKG